MQERARLLKGTTALVIALSAILVFSSGVQAFADSVNNNANARHLTVGDSTSVGYSIQATGHDGCDASIDNPITIALDGVPDGVTVSPDELTFTSCDTTQDFTFTATESAQPQNGPYKVTVVVVSGSGITNLSPGNLNLFIKGTTQPEVVVDTTAPEITYSIDGELGENDWYVSDVIVTWTVIDPESTVTSTDGCDTTTIDYDTDGVTLTCTATSEGGESSESVTIKRDATAPDISGSRTPDANANGWNNVDVTVHFDASDAMSGLASVTPDTVLSGDGAGQSVEGTATDNAGNTASTTVGDINIDKTAPSITTTRTPAPNSNGWNNEDVTVTFDASDGLSGLDDDATYSETVSTEGSGQSVTHTFTDLAGNSVDATEDDINIDKTAPTVTHSLNPSAPNSNGWFNQDVVVTFTASDGLSGIDGTDTQSTTLTNNAAGQSASATFTDLAGNTASDSASDINIDKVKPTITQNFFNVVMHQAVGGYASCFDDLSGIASCLVSAFTVNAGVGSTVSSPTVIATDNADNTHSQTMNFNVVGYGCIDSSGFKSPVPNTQYKLGRDLPLKFSACDLQGNPINGVVATAQYKLSTSSSWTNAVSGSSSTTGNLFRYDPSAGQYIFNMVTNGLTAGKAYNIRAVLDSGQTITATVTFTK